jgi:O-antigen ligase
LSRFWKITLWVLVLAMLTRITFLLRQRDASQFSTIDNYAALEVVISFLTGGALLASGVTRELLSYLRNSSLKYGLLLYALGVCSALWSPLHAFSLFRATEAAVEILAVSALVLSQRDKASAERAVYILFSAVIVLDIGYIIRVYGLTLNPARYHTNSYSASGAMMFSYCVVELFCRRNARLYGFTLFSLATLAIGTSGGSNIAALLGFCVGLAGSGKRGGVGLLVLCLAVGLVLLGGVDQLREILAPGKSDADIQDLSARTRLWATYWQGFAQNPVLGQGFAATPRLSELYETNAHNSFVAIAAGMGLAGIVLLVFWLSSLANEFIRVISRRHPSGAACAAALTAGWANSMSCGYIAEVWMSSTLMFFVFYAYFAGFVLTSDAQTAEVPAAKYGPASASGSARVAHQALFRRRLRVR